jgi:hypothetical protein
MRGLLGEEILPLAPRLPARACVHVMVEQTPGMSAENSQDEKSLGQFLKNYYLELYLPDLP